MDKTALADEGWNIVGTVARLAAVSSAWIGPGRLTEARITEMAGDGLGRAEVVRCHCSHVGATLRWMD